MPTKFTEFEDDYSDIILRPLDLSDADEFTQWYTDEKVAEFCWDPILDKDAAIKYVAEVINTSPLNMWQRAICLKGKPVGAITVVPPFDDDDAAEIGYLVGSKYWGRGIATRAVKMAVRAVLLEWQDLERIEAFVDVDNKGSQKVLLKAGFTEEDVLRGYDNFKGKSRDAVLFSLTFNRTD